MAAFLKMASALKKANMPDSGVSPTSSDDKKSTKLSDLVKKGKQAALIGKLLRYV